jgi:hypothetical protein
VRYTGSVKIVLKLSNVNVCEISPVSALTLQNDATSRTMSEPM